MKKWILLCLLALAAPLAAQNSKKVKDMKSQKEKLQQTLKKSQTDLDKTRKQVKKGQQTLRTLDREIEMRIQYIRRTEQEIEELNQKIDSLKAEIKRLEAELQDKKGKYVRSLRMAQTYREVSSSLLFALSARDVTQMYRRLRYTREYASHQRVLGEQVQARQLALQKSQNKLLDLKSQLDQKVQSLIQERRTLASMQVKEKKNVGALQKKEQGLQKQVKDQNAQIAALQKKIDEAIAAEIEAARKQAEKKQDKGSSGGSPSKWLTAEDKKLNGSFESNKGRLPVPLTGQYMVAAGYGANVSGQKGVTLSNKGVNYVGKSGARARAVFDGEVSAVFALGGQKNVLVRHGSYISVYCNLSSVIVAKGQKVKTNDLLGTVSADENGNYTLHFQLRKETALLNPQQWIGR